MPATLDMTSKRQEREQSVFTAKHEAQQLERQLLVSPQNKTVNAALRNICYALCRLAQKYVPNSSKTFTDHASLLQCAKLLQEMGLRPPLQDDTVAHVAAIDSNIVVNSIEYRCLRNRAIACLATIADLTEKPTATGSPDYQKGMREGYRRASDIAAAFLLDFNAGDCYDA